MCVVSRYHLLQFSDFLLTMLDYWTQIGSSLFPWLLVHCLICSGNGQGIIFYLSQLVSHVNSFECGLNLLGSCSHAFFFLGFFDAIDA